MLKFFVDRIFEKYHLALVVGHNGNGVLTPDEEQTNDDGADEEVAEIVQADGSVNSRPDSSLKSEVG